MYFFGSDCAICQDPLIQKQESSSSKDNNKQEKDQEEDEKEGDKLVALPCNAASHVFHAKCIERWLRVSGTCPVCRVRVE
jgi:phosphomannomutase